MGFKQVLSLMGFRVQGVRKVLGLRGLGAQVFRVFQGLGLRRFWAEGF